MIEEEAVVASVEGGQIWVEKPRKSACGTCSQRCASAVVADHVDKGTVRLAVSASIFLRTGDRVVVGVPEGAILLGALGVYLLPLVGLLAGAILGKAIGSSLMSGATDLAAIVGGLVGLVGTLAFLKLTPLLARYAPQPVVLRKLS